MARGKPTSKPRNGLPTYPRVDLLPPEHVISSLAELGQVALACDELNDEDREAVEQAVQQLQYLNETEFLRLILQVTDSAPVVKRLIEQIGTIAGAAYLIGAHYAMTDTSRVFFERSRALHMRVGRETSSKEQRLRDAIEAERKANGISIPSEHPYKDAERILTGVNARLSEDERASLHMIARRLQLRSSRSQKK